MKAYRKVKTYKIPFKSFDSALRQMKFRRVKTTPFVAHYRREDGLHVTLSSTTHRKGRVVKRELGEGNRTIVKVHKDTGFPHKGMMLDASEREKFLSELLGLSRNPKRIEFKSNTK